MSLLVHARYLGEALGCLLLQLPPSFAFDQAVVSCFAHRLRTLHSGPVSCEPRHASWSDAAASRVLRDHDMSRVDADPSSTWRGGLRAGDRAIEYVRMHGSPRIYYDAYPLATLARVQRRPDRSVGFTSERCSIFDNTALCHATGNALTLINAVQSVRHRLTGHASA